MLAERTSALADKVADAAVAAPANTMVYGGWIEQLGSSIVNRDQEAVIIALRSMQGAALDFLPEDGVLTLSAELGEMFDLALQLDQAPTSANPAYQPQPYRANRLDESILWRQIQSRTRALAVTVFSGGPINRQLYDFGIDGLRNAIAKGDRELAEAALADLKPDPALLAGTVGVRPILQDAGDLLRLVLALDDIPGVGGAEKAPPPKNSQNPFLIWTQVQDKAFDLSRDVYVARLENQLLYDGALHDLRRAIIRMDQNAAQVALDSLLNTAVASPALINVTGRVAEMRALLFEMPLVGSFTFKAARPLADNARCGPQEAYQMTHWGELSGTSFALHRSTGPLTRGRLERDGTFDVAGTHSQQTLHYVGKLNGGPGSAIMTDSIPRGCEFTWDVIFKQGVGPFPMP
jgi:hypothetical protein